MATETKLVEEHLQCIINQIAAEQKFQKFDTKIAPVSSGGANYTSNLFKLKITHEDRVELDLFVKVGVLNENIRNQLLFNPFDNESLFYNFLVKTYRQLEEKHGVLEKDKLNLPVYYAAEVTYGREILILEDLTCRGFGPANRFVSVEWPYAAAAVAELAKLHALSLAFKHENLSEFEKFTAHSSRGFFKKCDGSDIFIKGVISSALAAVRPENKEQFHAFFKKHDCITYFNDLIQPLRCNVILHGDFRPSNMLHKVNDDTTEVISVDYQAIQAGSPVTDLFYFIFTATNGSFREKYLKKLINHYHAELGAALARLDLNVELVYSRQHFELELREKLPFGLLTAVQLLPALTAPEDKVPALGEDFTTLATQPTGDLYSQRLNEVIDEYVTWGVLGENTDYCIGNII